MGRSQVFNGLELVIPDAYSALDVSRLLTPTSGGVGIVALVGEADGGKPGLHIFPGGASPGVVKSELKSGPLADMVRLALRSGSDGLVQGGASTVVAYKTNNSTQSQLGIGGLASAVQEIYTLLFSSAGSFYDVIGAGKKLHLAGTGYLWFNVTDGVNTPQTDPTGPGTGYQVDILLADTAAQIAGKAQVVANGITGLSATVLSATVTVTHTVAADVTPDASAETSGVTVTTTQQGVSLDAVATIVAKTKQYGLFTASYTGEMSSSGGKKFLTVRDENGVPEISVGVEFDSYGTLLYSGNGSAATMELKYVSNLLKLQTTLTGQSDGSVNLDLNVSGMTLSQLKNSLSAYPGYTFTVVAGQEQMLVSDLDLVIGATSIKPTAYSFKAGIFELIQWGATQSLLVEFVRGLENEGAKLPSTSVTTLFTGGTKGTTSNSTVQSALNELLDLRINILVPLFCKDNQDGSTVTIAAINAQVKDHVQSRSAILGKSECQAYVCVQGNKQAFIDMVSAMNSRWVAVTSQKVTDLDIDGNVKVFDEYAFSVVCAQTQSGSPIGTDLTYRSLPILGLTQDVSWNPSLTGQELIKKGCLIGGADENNTLRVIAGYTSWLQDDNNANIYIETVESLAIFAFNHRSFMKQRFLGQSAFTRQDVVDAITQSLEVERDTTKSIKGFDLKLVKIISVTAGRLEYEVAVVPFEGIKFVLPTVVAIREV